MVEMAAVSAWSYYLWPWNLADCQKARQGIVFFSSSSFVSLLWKFKVEALVICSTK